jgi:hypothetical protein
MGLQAVLQDEDESAANQFTKEDLIDRIEDIASLPF